MKGGGGGGVSQPSSELSSSGVFDSQENERKGEEMKEMKRSGKTPARFFVLMKLSSKITYLSFYSAHSKKNYKNISNTHYT